MRTKALNRAKLIALRGQSATSESVRKVSAHVKSTNDMKDERIAIV